MTIDTDRISGYADALDAIEAEIREQIRIGDARTRPGLEIALTAVRSARINANQYYDHLLDMRE